MKIKLIKLSLMVIVGLYMTSCSSYYSYYYQVYEVGTNDMKVQDNSLVYENEDCKVLYNLWSNNGELKFAVLNKTDKDIFVNMGQSFYVVNGQAVDYYQGREFSSQSTTHADFMISSAIGTVGAYGFWGNDVYMENVTAIADAMSAKLSKTQSNGVITREKEIVCIPSKCFKVFNYYKVNPTFATTCENDKDFPKKSYKVGIYTHATSPLNYKNRIAYGFNKKEVADKHIDNEFWISSVTNYSENEATEKYKKKTECYGQKTTSKARLFKVGGPDKFYKVYVDNSL